MDPEKRQENVDKSIDEVIKILKDQGISDSQIIDFLNKRLKPEEKYQVEIPVSIFNNDALSSLETIVKYMRENLLLTFKQIGDLTNRNQIALAVSYRSAKKKLAEKFSDAPSVYKIPISILKNRNLSVLENIVHYLKDSYNLNYHSIAILLNRNDRTIWTVYQRAKRKLKNE